MLVVYRYKVVIEDNHLRIQLDSQVIHSLTIISNQGFKTMSKDLRLKHLGSKIDAKFIEFVLTIG